MANKICSYILQNLKILKGASIFGIIIAFVTVYDAFASQFNLPTIGKIMQSIWSIISVEQIIIAFNSLINIILVYLYFKYFRNKKYSIEHNSDIMSGNLNEMLHRINSIEERIASFIISSDKNNNKLEKFDKDINYLKNKTIMAILFANKMKFETIISKMQECLDNVTQMLKIMDEATPPLEETYDIVAGRLSGWVGAIENLTGISSEEAYSHVNNAAKNIKENVIYCTIEPKEVGRWKSGSNKQHWYQIHAQYSAIKFLMTTNIKKYQDRLIEVQSEIDRRRFEEELY